MDLCLAFLYQPFDQASIVLLCMDVILVLRDESLRPELFLPVVNNSLQLTVFGDVTRSRLLIQRFLRLGQSRGQSSVNVELSSRTKFVHSKQETLCSLWLYVNDGVDLFFCQFEILLCQN